MEKREAPTADIVYDYDTGRYTKVNQQNGDSKPCDVQGRPIPHFYQVLLFKRH